jgi:hypothetical protein
MSTANGKYFSGNGRFSLGPALFAVGASMFFFTLDEVFDIWEDLGGDATALVMSGCIFLSVRFIILRKVPGFFSYFVALMALISLIHFQSEVRVALAGIKLYVLPSRYSDCISAAQPVGKDGLIGVCERHFQSGGFERSVVYDSSDEISLPKGSQSVKWKTTVSSLQDDGLFSLSDSYLVEKVSGHFYRVEFSP